MTKMEFIWPVSGDGNHTERMVWDALKRVFSDDEGICYFRYPIFSVDKSRREPDFLMLHRRLGLYVIECKGCTIDNIERIEGSNWVMRNWHSSQESPFTQAEDQMFPILGKFNGDNRLRKGRQGLVKGHVFIALPLITRAEWEEKGLALSPASPTTIIFADDLEAEKLRTSLANVPAEEKQEHITDEQFRIALGILQGVPVLNRETRPEPHNVQSKAAMLRQVELQMQTIDREQQRVAVQIPDGPQRIRGLAGSGKTVVMCMKAAEIHRRFPNWHIGYTFYTHSLRGQIRSLITRFYRYWSEQDPDWTKIHILHGWGGRDAPGLYSTIARKMGHSPRTFTEARNVFEHKEHSEILGLCCGELLTSREDVPEIFDVILIDEAQDFHFDFYKLCYNALKEPKRLIWAYDEVQSLESLSIPTTIDIFGIHPDGTPVVDLDGTYPGGEIEKDVILHRCYRTPRPVLVTAHIFGMGLLRPQGAIQFIPTQGGWEDIGYEIVSGKFQAGQSVTVRRPEVNSPHLLEKLAGYKDLIQWEAFNNRFEEMDWIAQQIHKNIEQDELRPEEIIVISLEWKGLRDNFSYLEHCLSTLSVSVVNTATNTDREVFQKKGYVTLASIFKAKGNEASIVYVMGVDRVDNNPLQIVQDRNQAFTAMTRARGWCILTGIGKRAEALFNEIDVILSNDPEHITFTVPDPKTIQRNLDNLEYEKRRNRMKKAEGLTSQLKRTLADIDDPDFIADQFKRLLTEISDSNLRKAIMEQLQHDNNTEGSF